VVVVYEGNDLVGNKMVGTAETEIDREGKVDDGVYQNEQEVLEQAFFLARRVRGRSFIDLGSKICR